MSPDKPFGPCMVHRGPCAIFINMEIKMSLVQIAHGGGAFRKIDKRCLYK